VRRRGEDIALGHFRPKLISFLELGAEESGERFGEVLLRDGR